MFEMVALFLFMLVVLAIVLPIIALVCARKAVRDVEALGVRVGQLRAEAYRIEELCQMVLRRSPELVEEKPEVAKEEEITAPVLEKPTEPEPEPVLPAEKLQPDSGTEPEPVPGSPDAAPPESIPAPEPRTPPPMREAEPKPSLGIEWESFTGARLFAWVGGLALFLGMSFLVKYSIDRGLLSPMVRIVIGFLVGAGSVWGGLTVRSKGYAITAHALTASGVAVLYAVIFAAFDLYGFIGTNVAFLLMILVTVMAFLLADRQDSIYTAALGLLGGFLTPVLVSSGQDNPLALFVYVACLDLGLFAVALRKKWLFFIPLSALGTVWMQLGWMSHFFQPSRVWIALIVFGLFSFFYSGLAAYAERTKRLDNLIEWTAGSMSLLSIFLGFHLISFDQLAGRPGLVFSFVFLVNLILSGLMVLNDRFRLWQTAGGALSFLLLVLWTQTYLTMELLGWALAFYLLFAILHCIFPILLQRTRPVPQNFLIWGNLYPLLMLLPIIFLIVKLGTVPAAAWVFVLVLDGLAVVASFLLASFWIGAAALALTLGAVWVGLLQMPEPSGLSGILGVMAFFSLAFFAVGVVLERRNPTPVEEEQEFDPASLVRLPILSALMPFLLLVTVCLTLEIASPFAVFGLALVFVVLLLGLVVYWRVDPIALVALGSVSLLQFVWYLNRFDPAAPLSTLLWNALFWAVFALFPFLFLRSRRGRLIPWLAAGFAGPIQFFLIYGVVSRGIGTAWIGILPALFAVGYLSLVAYLLRLFPGKIEELDQRTRVAVFAGITLFFVSLVFPLQWENEWLTIGWALEGLALVWLFRWIAHPALKKWAAGLLAISFVRLALNPAVLDYHPRSALPIMNWYLYGYGAVILCLLFAAFLWRPHEEKWFGWPVTSGLLGMAVVLSFLILNIEIADFYSTGAALTFEFGQSLAQDLTYSLAWALFGFVLLVIGIRCKSRLARLASLCLISVTTVKLFIYDLWSLDQLYRVGAFVGLAVILVLVSSLYQKYLDVR